jgi:hypothetical protein
MADAFTSSYVNHVGRANRDYVLTLSNKSTVTLPKDVKVVIVDMDLSRDRCVIWWESKDFYAPLTIQAARSLVITLPERYWTTENTQGRMLSLHGDSRNKDKCDKRHSYPNVRTVDKYNKSITYDAGHCGYVSRVSTDGMSFIVNILHGPDVGRKGVRIPIVYGFPTDKFADYWMFRRLTFVKDYTCIDRNDNGVYAFKKGDRSCVVHGVDVSAMVLRVKSSRVDDSQLSMQVDISAHAVVPDTCCNEAHHIDTIDGPMTVDSNGWLNHCQCDEQEEMRQSRYKIPIPPPSESDVSPLNRGAHW